MGGHKFIREVHESLCLRDFPKYNSILMHYMISTRWLHLVDGLGHYSICLGSVAYIMVMTNNIMTLGYTYAKRRLNNPPKNFCKIARISRLIAWAPSRLAWIQSLWGRDLYLLRYSLPKEFSRNNKQKSPNNFDTSTRYTLWDSGCTHSINPYFEI